MCSRTDACGPWDVEADVSGRRQHRLTGVEADANMQRRLGEVALQARCAGDRGARARKRREERVALRVHDAAVRVGDRRIDEAAVFAEQFPVRVLADPR